MNENILTKEQLRNYNIKMLNLGAPNKYDFQGYNKLHYKHMEQLAQFKKLSDKQAAWIAKTLKFYTNTQLTELKNVINATIQFYSNNPSSTQNSNQNKNVIQVINVNESQCSILWNFDKNINNQLKGKLDKEQYKWTKANSSFILNINLSYLHEAEKIFNSIGLNTSNLLKIISK